MDINTVKNIANLAKLQFNEEEAVRYSDALTTIFKLVEEMDKIDTSQVVPLFNSLHHSQPLREDVVTTPATQEKRLHERQKLQQCVPKNQNNTPYTEAGLYLVPQVIE